MVNANLTSGNRQSYDEGSGIRILQLLKPDIALIQEFNYKGNSEQDIRALVDECTGKEFHYYRGKTGGQNGIPNGIISRYPILEAGEIEDGQMRDRNTVWAKIQLPNGKILWAMSAHLSHGDDDKREAGARAMVEFAKEKVGPNDLLVMGGDFNTTNRNEPTLHVLSEVVTDKHVPVDVDGNSGTSANRHKPYDFVLPNSLLDGYHTCLTLLAKTGEPRKFPNGVVLDTRTFRDISRFPPARQGDSGALNMQHMAVAKDFEMP